jgi:hypothetical protein
MSEIFLSIGICLVGAVAFAELVINYGKGK